MNLSEELILYIIDYLSGERDKYSLATTNKKLWSIATLPQPNKLTLMNRINSLNIRRLTHLVIENRFYEPRFIAHVLKYATNLSKITFKEREKFSIKFVQNFMTIERKCLFTVPAKALDLFIFVIEDSENEYITVDMNSDSKPFERMKTPEEVARKVEVLKSVEKAKYFENENNPVVMKNQLSHLVRYHDNRLFNSDEYMLYDNSHTKNIDDQQVNRVVSFCETFMEAVVILGGHWFFTTSFCIFIHSKSIDDCADGSQVGFQEEAVSFIRRKTQVGHDYFELNTRFSNVELLSTSGFFGSLNCNSVVPFVGSSIQKLPTEITETYEVISSKDVFIPVTAVAIVKVERLLKQYIKTHAANKWMFISAKYKDKGFEPSHPLSFQSENNIQKAASLLLKAFVHKTLYKQEMKEALENIQIIPETTLTASGKLIKEYLLDLNKKDEFLLEEHNLMKLKKDMLFVYDHILAGAIKRKNMGLMKRTENLFNKEI